MTTAAYEGRIAIVRLSDGIVLNVIVAESVGAVEALGPAHCPAGCILEDVRSLPVSPGWVRGEGGFYREGNGVRETIIYEGGEPTIGENGWAETELTPSA